MGVSWWVSGLLGASDGTRAGWSHQSPTFQCEAMRVSANPCKVGVWVTKVKKNRSKQQVCAKKKSTTPNKWKNSWQHVSTTTPGANITLKFLRRRVVCSTAVHIRAQHFSQLKTVGRAETFESWPSEKGVNSKWKTKKKTCPWLIGSRLSQRYIARFASCN